MIRSNDGACTAARSSRRRARSGCVGSPVLGSGSVNTPSTGACNESNDPGAINSGRNTTTRWGSNVAICAVSDDESKPERWSKNLGSIAGDATRCEQSSKYVRWPTNATRIGEPASGRRIPSGRSDANAPNATRLVSISAASNAGPTVELTSRTIVARPRDPGLVWNTKSESPPRPIRA